MSAAQRRAWIDAALAAVAGHAPAGTHVVLAIFDHDGMVVEALSKTHSHRRPPDELVAGLLRLVSDDLDNARGHGGEPTHVTTH